MINRRLFVALALVLGVASVSDAQQLTLQIKDGRVTLDAAGVPARQILAEWARVGGTKVVGGDRTSGTPLTLKLVDMPERQALDIILRNVAGFMAAPRQASAAPGASTYDRILVLATSASAPANAAAAPARPNTPGNPAAGMPGSMAGTQRRVPARPPNLPPSPAEDTVNDEPQQEEEVAAASSTQPVFTFPAPPGAGPVNPVFVPVNGAGGIGRNGQPGQVTAPMISLQPNPNGQPTIYNFVPTTDGTAPPTQTPGPFQVIGSPTPGMIQQPVQQPGQTSPRPPGDE